ncbi:hypothetical protein [Bacillus sp. REN3]|uniref:hypothetical protein n=1 Tax=Bacillus sp. REN3 TaxID=2802440 RepID=UPI001AEDF7CD|nr:hypothetical protein [Bacillus sp. REN3]
MTVYAKAIGVIVGLMVIIGGLWIGLLGLFANMSGSALNSSAAGSNSNHLLFIFVILFGIGLLTVIGVFMLDHKIWHVIYPPFCFLTGMVLTMFALYSIGSLGIRAGMYSLLTGLLYLLLGYLAKGYVKDQR